MNRKMAAGLAVTAGALALTIFNGEGYVGV